MTKVLNVLVVDDVALNRKLVESFVTKLGHSVRSAANGFEAVLQCDIEAPDVILMDVVMPMMNGFEATRRIRELIDYRWIPIIFLSALDEHENLIEGFEAGGDDFLTKPVDYQTLAAKLAVAARVVNLQEQREEYAKHLQQYFVRNEEEQMLARHVMTRLSSNANHVLRNIATEIRAAEKFSGDIVLALRSPSGVDHLLLGDSTGHGLTAAITCLPVVDAFVAMTERGFASSAIVRTINRKLRQSLPTGHFMAAAIVAIDHAENVLSVWNGGIPELVFMTEPGRITHRFRSEHPALGILGDEDFDNTPSLYRIPAPGSLVICSDGVSEAMSNEGKMFNLDAALISAESVQPELLMGTLFAGLEEHAGRDGFHDDVSVIVAACHPDFASPGEGQQERTSTLYGGLDEWQVSLTFNATQLKGLDCIMLLTGWINQLGLSQQQLADILLIITEMFSNALDHGVLGLDSTIKNEENGFYRYMSARLQRLAVLESGFISIELRRHTVGEAALITIITQDSGNGFDVNKLNQPEGDEVRSHGRGIALIRSKCSNVRFLNGGCRVEADYVL